MSDDLLRIRQNPHLIPANQQALRLHEEPLKRRQNNLSNRPRFTHHLLRNVPRDFFC